MIKIIGKQCRTARSLLKWNFHDLVRQTKGLTVGRLNDFEHGAAHLLPWENEEIIRAFKKAGVVFKSDNSVARIKIDKGIHPRDLQSEADLAALAEQQAAAEQAQKELENAGQELKQGDAESPEKPEGQDAEEKAKPDDPATH